MDPLTTSLIVLGIALIACAVGWWGYKESNKDKKKTENIYK